MAAAHRRSPRPSVAATRRAHSRTAAAPETVAARGPWFLDPARRGRTPSCGRSRARTPRRSGCCRETAADAARRRARAVRAGPSGSFQSQLPQSARVIGPVLAHLAPERQVKAAAEQVIELETGRPADTLEARPVGTD